MVFYYSVIVRGVKMSYIRYSHPYRFVDGNSDDYIWCGQDSQDGEYYIEDYGKISDNTLVELLAQVLIDNNHVHDPRYREYLLKKLSERLKVSLRPQKLTVAEWIALDNKNMDEWKQSNDYKELFGDSNE